MWRDAATNLLEIGLLAFLFSLFHFHCCNCKFSLSFSLTLTLSFSLQLIEKWMQLKLANTISYSKFHTYTTFTIFTSKVTINYQLASEQSKFEHQTQISVYTWCQLIWITCFILLCVPSNEVNMQTHDMEIVKTIEQKPEYWTYANVLFIPSKWPDSMSHLHVQE